MKSTWRKINKKKGGKTKHGTDIQSLVINSNVIMNQKKITNILNSYFLSTADSVNSDNNKHTNTSITSPVTYL